MVYMPAEDSVLLEKWVKKHSEGKVLDIGTGSGVQAIAASENAHRVIAVDIDPEAVKYAEKKAIELDIENIEFRVSDLFSAIKVLEKFDLIIFNPPYLPKDEWENGIDTTGGEEGWEVIARFLEEAKTHLKKNGRILLLFSSLTKEKRVIDEMDRLGYTHEKLDSMHVAFEDLFVYSLELKT